MVYTQAGDGASFCVRSCRVGRVVTHTIAGRNCGDESVRELEGGDTERWYVTDADTMRNQTGAIPGAKEARS